MVTQTLVEPLHAAPKAHAGLLGFLVACTRLNDPLRPSDGRSVAPSVRPSVHNLVFFHVDISF